MKAGVLCAKRAQRVNCLLLSILDAVGCAQVAKEKSLCTANAYVQVSLNEKTLTNKAKNVNSPRPRYAVRNPSEGTSGNANAMAVVQIYEAHLVYIGTSPTRSS